MIVEQNKLGATFYPKIPPKIGVEPFGQAFWAIVLGELSGKRFGRAFWVWKAWRAWRLRGLEACGAWKLLT